MDSQKTIKAEDSPYLFVTPNTYFFVPKSVSSKYNKGCHQYNFERQPKRMLFPSYISYEKKTPIRKMVNMANKKNVKKIEIFPKKAIYFCQKENGKRIS